MKKIIFTLTFFIFIFKLEAQPWPQSTWTNTGCGPSSPKVTKVFIDACDNANNPEGANEFVYITVGTSPWNWSNFTMIGSTNQPNYANNSGSPYFYPISSNFQSLNSMVTQLNNAVGPCPQPVFYIAPNPLPAGAAVMAIAASSGVNPPAGSISSLCGKGPVYVISGNYTNTNSGFFRNGGSTNAAGCTSNLNPVPPNPCDKNPTFNYGNGCEQVVSYNGLSGNFPPNQGNGTTGAFILADGTVDVGGCYDAPPCAQPPAPVITPLAYTVCAGIATLPNNQTIACSNCGINNGNYNVFTTATGGIPIFVGNNFPTGYSLANLPAGTTTFYVTQTGFCESPRTPITITKSDGPTTATVKTDANCAIAPGSGTATVTPSGTPSPYTYIWSNGGNTQTISNLLPGTYNVTVTDGQTCTKTAVVTIGSPPELIVGAGVSTVATCVTPGTSTVTVSGGSPNFTYNWGNSTNATLSTLTPGTYTVTVTDNKGCTKTQAMTITGNVSTPTAVATSPNTITCGNPTISISGTGSSSGGFTYNWSGPGIVSGGTTLSPTVNAIGAYTITVTNTADGCTQKATVTVGEDKALPTATIATPSKITCSVTSVQLNATPSGGTSYTSSWSGPGIVSGGTSLNPIVNQTGTYTITLTNSVNGCTKTQSIVVTDDKTPPAANAGPDKTLNCINNQSVNLSATGPSGSTFAWSNNQNGATTTVLSPGTYTVTVTSGTNGCTATDQVVVTTDITPPSISPIPQVTVSCGTPNPAVTVSATGGNLQYNWSNGGSSSTNQFTTPGTYSVVVTNASNGCTSTESFTVIEDKVKPIAVLAPPLQLTCATGGQIVLDPTGSSSGVNYNYLWAGPSGLLGNSQSGITVTTPGTYNLVVANQLNGCTKLVSVSVSGNVTPPTGDAGPNLALNCFNNGQVTIGNAGSGNQTYLWSGGPTTSSNQQIITTPGLYTLTITNLDNGCTKVTTVNVTQDNIAPVVNPIPQVTVNCFTPTPTLVVTTSVGSNLTYNWSPSGSGANSTISAGGTYTVTVLNSVNGCKDTKTIVVPEDKADPTAVVATPPILNCYNNSSIALDPTGTSTGANFGYSWTGPGLNSTSFIPPNITAPGTYVLSVTNNANGCKKSTSVTLTQNTTLPTAIAGNPQTLNCYNNGQVTIGGASSSGANFTYNWSNGNTNATQVITTPGTYILTVTDSQNGCTKVSPVDIAENKADPTVNAGVDLFINCYTPIVSPTASAGGGTNLTYAWSGPGITGGGTTLVPTINQAGTYSITVTNFDNGCKKTDDLVVTSDVVTPTATATVSNGIDCNNASATLSSTGSSSGANFTYNWSGPNSFSSTNAAPTVTVGGAYILTVTNITNGCKKTFPISVNEDKTAPTANAGGTQSVTCTNPTIQLNGTGSTGSNFTYNWSGPGILLGSTTLTPSINQAGTYILTVTNTTTGCTNTATATVNENKIFPVAASTGGGGIITCTAPTINLGVNVTSGSNLQFQWSATGGGNIVGSPNQQNIVANQGGTYNVTITNATNGCSITSAATLTANNTLPTSNAVASGIIDCNNPNATLDGTTSSQGANFTFVWSGPSFTNNTTLQPTVTKGGAYTLDITNTSNGCTATKTIVVTEDKAPPSASLGTPGQINCLTTTVTIQGTGAGTNLYSWSTANGNIVSGSSVLSPTVDKAGTYVLNVINPQNGCQATYSTTIVENKTNPTVIIANPSPITCTNPTVILNAGGTSQGGNFQLIWSANPGAIQSGLGSTFVTTSTAGVYTLLVTDNSNGCTMSKSVTVVDDRSYPVAVANPDSYEINCSIVETTINSTGSSFGANFNYTWTATNGGTFLSGQNTATPKVKSGGTYTLVVTNTLNNCTTTKDVTITQNTSKPTVNAGPAKIITCSASTVQLQGSGSQGGQYGYQWYNAGSFIPASSGGNTFTPTVSQVGTYFLVITNSSSACKDTASTTVALDQGVPVANAGNKKELNCTVSSVQLDGTGSTVGAGLTYNWTFNGTALGQNTLTPTVNKAGIYKLEVVNTTNGCKGNASVQVDDNTKKPTLEIAKPNILNCTKASLTLNGNGSSTGTNFNYNWTTANGNIVKDPTTLTPTIDKAGIYVFKIKNTQNNCEKDSTVTIVDNFNKPVPSYIQPALLTCVQPTTVIDASASTKVQNAKIQWITSVPNSIVSGKNTLKPVINEEGDYLLILTDTLSNCVDSVLVKAKKDANIPTANAGPTSEINCSNKTLVLAGTATASPTITYTWSTVGGNIVKDDKTLTPTVNKAGKYTLKVVDSANQCIKESTVNITTDTILPVVKFVKPTILNCKTTVMPLDASGSSSGSNIYKYNWKTPVGAVVSGAGGLTPLVNKPGTYVLTITNSKNTCVTTDSIKIKQDIVKPQANIAKTDTLNCRNLDLKLKGTASANSGFYNFEWKTPLNGIIKDPTTLTPTINQPGNYQLVVTDTSNYCVTAAQITVIKDVLTPIISAGAGGNLTCTLKDLIINGTATQGNPNDFIYNWTTPNGNIVGKTNETSIKIDNPGKYIFQVLNNVNGCKSKDSTTVTQDANVPVVQILASGDLDCKAKTLLLDGSGSTQGTGITFTWTASNGGSFVKDQNTLKPTVNSAGVYTLQINNTNNNCIKEIKKSVTIDTLRPSVTVSQDIITCKNPTTDLVAKVFLNNLNNLYTFDWTNNTGIVSPKNNLQITVNAKGIYTLTVKNSDNDCETVKNINVLEDKTKPTVDCGPALEINCQDSILTLQGNKSSKGASFIYNWTTTNGFIIDGETTLNPKVNKDGLYTLNILDNSNGCSDKNTVDIKINKQIPTITFVKPDTLTCKKTQIDVFANSVTTGAAQYTWSAGANGNITSSDKTKDNVKIDRPGIYTLNIIDDKNKCKSKANVTVLQDTIYPTVDAGANIELNCKNPTIDVEAKATGKNLAYTWSTINGNIVANGNKPKVTVKSAGVYDIAVVNTFNGCKAKDNMEVTFLGAPKAIVLAPDKLTCARKTVVLDSKGSDSGTIYTYTWSDANGVTLGADPTLSITQPGVYNFKVLNTTNDCEKKEIVKIEQDIENPIADAGSNATISCDKGFAILNAKKSSQGTKFTYLWKGGVIDGGEKTVNPIVSAQAVYTLLVTNTDNGCTASDTVGVISLKPAVLQTASTDPLCNGGKGAIEFKNTTGGTPPYKYSVDGGKTFFTNVIFKNLKPGDYKTIVQDSKNCQDTTDITINNTEKLTIVLDNIYKTKIGEDIQLKASFKPANPPLKTITWSPDSTLSCKNCLDPTVKNPKYSIYFTLKVVNENGCTAETFTTVDVDRKIGVFVPTSFSPNGDDINDRFIVFGNPDLVLKVKWMRVFDRWGDVLYEENDIKIGEIGKGWDGKFRGEDMNPGVFVWNLEVEFTDGTTKKFQGDVTLQR